MFFTFWLEIFSPILTFFPTFWVRSALFFWARPLFDPLFHTLILVQAPFFPPDPAAGPVFHLFRQNFGSRDSRGVKKSPQTLTFLDFSSFFWSIFSKKHEKTSFLPLLTALTAFFDRFGDFLPNKKVASGECKNRSKKLSDP